MHIGSKNHIIMVVDKERIFIMVTNWKAVPHDEVKVTDKYYDEALHIQVRNMLLLDPDRLLAGFRETAGYIAGMNEAERRDFMKGKTRYSGDWEDGMIGGHTLGHYIMALAQAVANPGMSEDEKAKVKERLDYIIDALKECQNKTHGTKYEGYLFGATLPTKEFTDNPAQQFDNVEKGLSNLFTEAWVPWYTMHKIVTGLNAAFALAGSDKALEVDNSLAEWIIKRTESWSEETNKTVLSIEYGGMNDCLYELYDINSYLKKSGDKRAYADPERIKSAAHRFDEVALFEKVLSGEKNAMNNTHANTTIPKFIGALARYEVDRTEEKYLAYAESFWEMVVGKHTYVTGGNSENEHFGEDNVLDAERTNVNNETCNTHNMLKFSRRLFAVTGNKKYLDYAENTLINAIMASQNHDTGFTTYFQPMATGYQKVFNTLDGNFWCCTGTGYENFTKLQRGIYFTTPGKLLVSMYLASEYENKDYKLVQECDFTESDKVKIKVISKDGKGVRDSLLLRVPTWIKGKMIVKAGDMRFEAGCGDKFLEITAADLSIISGNSGEAVLEITLPMGISCWNLPDGPDTYAFCYGPYVLSARLGNVKMKEKYHGVRVSVAAEKAVDSDTLNITGEKSVGAFIENIDKYLVKRADSCEFDLFGVSKPLVFTTHFNQYTESYGIYWKYTV